MLRLKIFLLALLILHPLSANANAVTDVFNYNREVAKSAAFKDYLRTMRSSEGGSVDIAKYVGVENSNGKNKFVETGEYNCGNNPDFDGASINDDNIGPTCRDWALEENNNEIVMKTSAEHLRDIQKILGDTEPLNAKDEDHLSVAVEFMRCLSGEVEQCSNLRDWTPEILTVEDATGDESNLTYMFGPERKFFITKKEKGEKELKNHPVVEGEYNKEKFDVGTFVRENITDNVCNRMDESKPDYASTAYRLALAQGYAYAVSAGKTANAFSNDAVGYLHELTSDKNKYNPKTIRQDIHMLIAADAGIIYLLGQINNLQSLMTEIRSMNEGIGGIKTFNGVASTVGASKSLEDLCKKQ